MKSKTAIILLTVALVSVLLLNGVNINVNHTLSFQVDDRPATLEEVILSLLEGKGQYGEPEVFLIQPNQNQTDFYGQGAYGEPFYKNLPPVQVPSVEERKRWDEILIGPSVYELEQEGLEAKKAYDNALEQVEDVLKDIPNPE